MGVHHAALMCHAPIVIPAVGRDRAGACATTTAAMRAAARGLVASRPDALLVISPHTPRDEHRWGLVASVRIRGDLASFGAPRERIDLPAAPSIRDALGEVTVPVKPAPLDHGAAVPLWFLCQAGWDGPTAVLALPRREEDPEGMGDAVAAACRRSGERWAVLASGDMSHRLIPGAPSGFHPGAAAFDAAFVERVEAGDLRGAAAIDAGLRALAAEDVVTSVTVAAAAVGWRNDRHQLLAYEGPFGVGYCEAVLYEDPLGRPAAVVGTS